jgi:toxin ParE1/3/4
MPRMIWNGFAITSPRTVLSPRGGVAQSVIERIGTLEVFPHLGRPGRVRGTREIAFPPLPFVAIYEVGDEQIIVLRILHGAQRWPR